MKMLRLFFFIIVATTLSESIKARLFLDISIISRKGIDSELTLGSELHASEEVYVNRSINLKLKSGLEVTVKARFDEKVHELSGGPSDKVIVEGSVKDSNGDKIKNFLDRPIHTYLGQKEVLSHSLKNERIEISILPYMR